MKKTDTTKRAQEKRKGFTKKIGNTTYDVSFPLQPTVAEGKRHRTRSRGKGNMEL